MFFIWEKTKNGNELPTPEALKKYMCNEAGERRCRKKARPIKHKRTDEPFTPLSAKDLEMEELMANMGDMGHGMKMYDRETMMDEMAGQYGIEDEDEELPPGMMEQMMGGGKEGMPEL